jgi:hypothetical protein
MATGALIVSLLSAAASHQQGRKAAKIAKEGRLTERAVQQADAVKQLRQSARSARVRRAQVIQGASNSGSTGSSGEIGALSSISSRLGGAQSFLRGKEVATSAISSSNQRAADANFRSGVFSNISSLSSQFAKIPSGGGAQKSGQVFDVDETAGATDLFNKDAFSGLS